jgi:hypothetical protein
MMMTMMIDAVAAVAAVAAALLPQLRNDDTQSNIGAKFKKGGGNQPSPAFLAFVGSFCAAPKRAHFGRITVQRCRDG